MHKTSPKTEAVVFITAAMIYFSNLSYKFKHHIFLFYLQFSILLFCVTKVQEVYDGGNITVV